MSEPRRHRLDDLRRYASALATAQDVPPSRASALAAHLLWYDAAGAAPFGIATLPDWLERISTGAVDPSSEGRVVSEWLGTAVFDAQRGLPPLILARAGELAIEKARDAGIGLVRVENVAGYSGPSAAVTAEMALGPVAALALGPDLSCSISVPSDLGLPAVFDSALDHASGRSKSSGRTAKDSVAALVLPWAMALAPDGGWLVAALAVRAIEHLSTFQERVGALMRDLDESPGRLLPGPWEARRRDLREHGLALAPALAESLGVWAARLGVARPEAHPA